MKVCFLTTSYPRGTTDGYARFVHEQAKSLLRLNLGYQITVIAPHAPGLLHQETIDGVAVLRFSYFWPESAQCLAYQHEGLFSTIRRSWLAAVQLPFFLVAMFRCALVACRNADVVHAQWLPTTLVAYPVSALHRIPMFVSARGADVNVSQSLVQRAIMKFVSRANTIFVVSDQIKLSLSKQYPKLPIKCLYNGVDTEQFVSVQESPSDASVKSVGTGAGADVVTGKNERESSKANIIYVGGLIQRKRVDTLLNALSCIEKKDPCLVPTLNIVGEGLEEKRLKNMVQQLNLGRYVQFSGKMDPVAVAKAIAAADMLVLPSESEGRPNVVLEAFASGVAVVASDIPGTSELVTDGITGRLFKIGDAENLAAVLEALLKDSELRYLLASNAKNSLADNKLSWLQHARELHKAYRKN